MGILYAVFILCLLIDLRAKALHLRASVIVNR